MSEPAEYVEHYEEPTKNTETGPEHRHIGKVIKWFVDSSGGTVECYALLLYTDGTYHLANIKNIQQTTGVVDATVFGDASRSYTFTPVSIP